jgi:NitT/TauT family transport system ATP-binding protein
MILEVQSVGRIFQSGTRKKPETVTALENVSFGVREGEFVSIIGPSGCGKSTLLKIVAGLIDATGGTIKIARDRAKDGAPQIGFVFQDAVLLPWKTAMENVMFPFEIMGKTGADRQEEVRRLFALAGLAGFEDSYPKQLSGGMRQRVSILRSLSYNPPILLMDEPFGAIDAITRDSLNNILQDIWQETGKTILFVTHSISEAIYLSDRVIVMGARPGRIVKEVSIGLPRPRNDDTKIAPAFYEYVRELRDLLKQEGEG